MKRPDKVCTKCSLEKPETEFPLRSKRTAKRHRICRQCQKTFARSSHLKTKYAISPEQYRVMLETQDGRCALCREPEAQAKRLAVDHCHNSGANRALLCQSCNTGIGKFKEDPALLRAAADFIEEHLGMRILNA